MAMINLCYLFPLLLVSLLQLSCLLKETWTAVLVAEHSIILYFSLLICLISRVSFSVESPLKH
jgi:hypothetical protein